MSFTIKIKGEHFVLHPTGATYWVEQEVLLIADVHLGKVSHFRKHGSAVPVDAINGNFEKMNQLLREFDPEHVVFMGDLFHSSRNLEWDLFKDWTTQIDNQIHLIAGNHDIISPILYEKLGISVHAQVKVADFLLTHHPETDQAEFNICGHIHPGYKMKGPGKQVLKLSCFFLSEDQLILPAFGEFTGNYFLDPGEKEQVFAITGKEVILVN